VSRLLRQAFGAGPQELRVLDVGGRANLLTQFTPYRVLTLNVDGTADLLYDGRTIPLATNATDAVVTIDTLEHLPKANRLPFLQECLRVAREHLIVAAPFGSQAHIACEKRLHHLYLSVHGKPHIYLSEHVEYGLPTAAELDELIQGLGEVRVQHYLAGDYRWQARQFERTILGQQKSDLLASGLLASDLLASGLLASGRRIIDHIRSLALFHPIRLHREPYATANRFYLLIKKKG
jgi:hypothetical protein